ncbi:MAG: nitronate monooxygenase [Candidatus Rokubacteria bacterium]|nr:nitronate monooxygenase [Candidatus Rokubacteria bacterium]MBI3826098.1 nitronate monooxygenase [Candidatus Rokubacteria bacterium]
MSVPFRTRLCDVLGIEVPIMQSGMGGVAGPELVAEVSRAGALGVLAALNMPPDETRRRIHRIRELTDRPFGVNLWLHSELRPPVDPATLPSATVAAVQGALNEFRARLGVGPKTGPPAQAPNVIDAAIDVIVDERVPVFAAGIGNPTAEMVRRCHARGIKVVSMVATVDDARAVAATGVDVIVAQGGEAGGHRSVGRKPATPETVSIGTMALVPQVVDAVRVPVVAAGGLADGRGLVAALALGATGILMGTRFVATRESAAPEFWKKALLERGSETTTLTDSFTGQWGRALRNAFHRVPRLRRPHPAEPAADGPRPRRLRGRRRAPGSRVLPDVGRARRRADPRPARRGRGGRGDHARSARRAGGPVRRRAPRVTIVRSRARGLSAPGFERPPLRAPRREP